MDMKKLIGIVVAIGSLTVSLSALADTVEKIEAPVIPLTKVTFPNGKVMNLTVGYSSGAFHRAGDPEDIVYSISDRGPNIKCKESGELIGLDVKTMCNGDGSGKIFPDPSFTPSIYKFSIKDGKATVLASYPLKGKDGKKLNGLSVPLTKNPTENAFDVNGKPITKSPNGFDSEALVLLKDGTFWISDEYAPSISHVSADGTVLERLVPAGTEGDYKGADYDVKGKLPAIIMKRTLNRGIEALSISPDEKTLYFIMQSPLSNPNKNAFKHSRTVRLFKFDIASEKILGEYAYQLDKPNTFTADSKKKRKKQGNVKISEMVAYGQDKLLVLERMSKTTKLYKVDLTGAKTIPAKFDELSTSPTLEKLSSHELVKNGVHHLTKDIAFDSTKVKGAPKKIEGVALLDPKHLILMTDNDFGIDGAKCHIAELTLNKALK